MTHPPPSPKDGEFARVDCIDGPWKLSILGIVVVTGYVGEAAPTLLKDKADRLCAAFEKAIKPIQSRAELADRLAYQLRMHTNMCGCVKGLCLGKDALAAYDALSKAPSAEAPTEGRNRKGSEGL